MKKFVVNLLFFFISVISIEYSLYKKDYCEMMIINEYVIYDVKNNDLTSFCNDKYCVNIYYSKDNVQYKITYKRKTILNFEWLKKISYSQIIK